MPYNERQASAGRERLAQAIIGAKGQPFVAASPVRVSAPVTSSYGQRVHPVTQQQSFHTGIDYGVPKGTPVYATAPGYVSQTTSAKASPYDPKGNSVFLQHPGGQQSRYEHLDKFSDQTLKGGEFNEGDLLGWSGDTGRSTGDHLHYGNFDASGQPMNPNDAMNIRRRDMADLMGAQGPAITGKRKEVRKVASK